MVMKTKHGFGLLLLLSVLVLFASLALARKDPELKQCKHQCKVQQQFDEKQTKRCIEGCEDYYEHKKGSGDRDRDDVEEEDERRAWEGQEGEEREDENPYIFGPDYFLRKVKTLHGGMFALPNFSRMSKFLRGIEQYKLGLLSIRPERFLTPHHLDADTLFVVFSGEGTITVIHKDKRHSFRLETGVLFRLPAGVLYHIVNSSNRRETLSIAQFLVPVNNPGNSEPFFLAAGSNQKSVWGTFSQEIREAVLKVTEDELEDLLEREGEDQGVFVTASKKQIRALSETTEKEGGGIWPFGAQSSKATFNLFDKRPAYSNEFGQQYEANCKDYPPLEDLEDLTVSYSNISKGAMVNPFYDSESTNIVLVIGGEGIVEIVCPHVSSSKSSRREHQRGAGTTVLKNRVLYEKIRAKVTPRTVFVTPGGHPVTIVASRRGNLELLGFRINSKNNVRYFFAGERNVVKQMQKEAKELTFDAEEEKVDRVFGSQKGGFFLEGPKWRQQPEQGQAYE